MTRRPLPRELTGSFSVGTALELGVTPDRLRGLPAQFRGVRSLEPTGDDAIALAHAFAPRLRPGQFFSHRTAGQLWRAPLPGFESLPLHVSAVAPARSPRSKNVIGHDVALPPEAVVSLGGLPVSSAAMTWAFLAEELAVHDAVAAGEYFITGNPMARQPPLTNLAELRAITEALGKRRGFRTRTAALAVMRPGPLSRPESLVRFVLEKSGIPHPEINAPCLDSRGILVAVPDLRWLAFRVALEYEGDYHRDKSQFRRDIHRLERLVDHGWLVVKVTADDLFARPDELVRRVAQRLASRGWHGEVDPPFLGYLRR